MRLNQADCEAKCRTSLRRATSSLHSVRCTALGHSEVIRAEPSEWREIGLCCSNDDTALRTLRFLCAPQSVG